MRMQRYAIFPETASNKVLIDDKTSQQTLNTALLVQDEG